MLLCQGNGSAVSRLALVGAMAMCELGYVAEQLHCTKWSELRSSISSVWLFNGKPGYNCRIWAGAGS